MDLCKHVKIKPMVNQIEFHPFWQRKEEMEEVKKDNDNYGIVDYSGTATNFRIAKPDAIKLCAKYKDDLSSVNQQN